MRRQLTYRTSGRVVLVAFAGSLAVGALTTPVGASTSMAKVIAGLADVNTNLGYQNAAAAGTGMVLTAKGEVLTNNHVIRGATTIRVRDVGNGHTYAASVVGYDVPADVAVLQLKGASGLAKVPIGNSSTVKVGASATVIGNAGGTGGTPTSASGTVTALGQSITASDQAVGTSEQLTGLIEMNAGIEPGDSGGALVSAVGKVIGMTTAASSGFEFQPGGNAGFAIPINVALSIERQIASGHFSGNVHRGATAFLGVDVRSLGYYSGGAFLGGVLVVGVVPASPAQKAGLAYGDVITSLNSRSITSSTALTNALLKMAPGSKVSLRWVDQDGTNHGATLALASGPPQ